MTRRLVLAAVAVVLLAGCGAAAAQRPVAVAVQLREEPQAFWVSLTSSQVQDVCLFVTGMGPFDRLQNAELVAGPDLRADYRAEGYLPPVPAEVQLAAEAALSTHWCTP